MPQVKHHVTGVQYWRSLEQLADTPEIRDVVAKEFPGYDADSISTGSRRSFLKLMSAAMALAGLTLTGCRRWPKEQLAPFSSNPAGYVPGVAEFYASSWELGGVGQGLLVKSFDGRPIKIEGNPSHPMCAVANGRYGASTNLAQASLLDMYDPQRNTGVAQYSAGNNVTASTWDAFSDAFRTAIQAKPDGFAVLSESTTSPSVLDMRQRLAKAFPQVKWYEYEPVSRDNELEGGRLAFGQAVRPMLHLNKADVVLSLDADVLGMHPACLRYSADWAQKRRTADDGHMSRVYMVESTYSTTGSVADVRLGATPARVYAVAVAIAAGLGVAGVQQAGELSPAEEKFVAAAVADLKKAGKSAVVTAGDHAAPAAHALAHAINAKLGATGNTVTYHPDPAGDRPTHTKAIAALADAMNAGQVNTLLILGGNPAYDAPADVNFKAALAKVGFSAHLSLYADETSQSCKWHLPRAHFLESWGDARGWDGTASTAQPLILPLFGGKSVIEVLALVTNDEVKAGEQIVRRTWSKQLATDLDWRRTLEQGVIPDTAFPAIQPAVRNVEYPAAEAAPAAGTFVVRVDANPTIYDGRFANNGWLQETPDPMSKLVWDNAAMISVRDAKALGIEQGDMIRIEANGQSLDIAAYLMPGQPQGVLSVTLGYGRTAAGPIGNDLGFNTYALVTTAAPMVIPGAKVARTGKTYTLVTTQEHNILEPIAKGAHDIRLGAKPGESGLIVRDAFFSEYKANPKLFGKERAVPLQLFEPALVLTDTHAWGMSIDMTACTGCGNCLVACQAENNIPIVGKEDSKRHREMNWIRVDRYFKGDPESDDVGVVHQVMLCQHCENAPCEQVCPVAATVHDSEGLNTMVYNRCIGTRYCQNNCPYKVRRFNYFDFHHKDPRGGAWAPPWPGIPDEQQNDPEGVNRIKRMVFNPDVTVRMRGVMEKCTYCVQRIHGATIAKRAAGSDVKDGDILTACQQACPTEAIVFGNYNETDSRVSKLRENPRSYQVLDELNTRPRTRYLAKLRNPSDDAVAATEGHEA